MKTTCGNIVLTLIALLVPSVSAESADIAMSILSLVNGTLSPFDIQAIYAGFEIVAPELDSLVKEVAEDVPFPSTRKLRVRGDRRLPCTNLCEYYATKYPICQKNGMDRCRRALTIHEDLLEEDVANLSEDDRHRHLTISALCQEAKSGVASAIREATSEGLIPIPPGSTVIEKCFYEYP